MSLPKLRVVDRARLDLAAIHSWLTQPGSGRKGHTRYAHVIAALLDLQTAPRRWPIGETPNVRERPVEGHRIYYRVSDDARLIEVLRIFGPWQDRAAP